MSAICVHLGSPLDQHASHDPAMVLFQQLEHAIHECHRSSPSVPRSEIAHVSAQAGCFDFVLDDVRKLLVAQSRFKSHFEMYEVHEKVVDCLVADRHTSGLRKPE